MEEKLRKLYYSPRGYWKGLAAIKKTRCSCRGFRRRCQRVAQEAGHLADLPAPSKAHSRVGRKTYTYALTVVDAASRYKEAEPLATKEAKEGRGRP